MDKTRLFAIVAAFFCVVAAIQLLIDERFAVAFMLFAALGIFAWHALALSSESRTKHHESAEADSQGEGTPLPRESLPSVLPVSQKRAMAVRSEQLIANEPMLSDTIINCLPGIFYFYDRDGHFLRWNKNFEDVSGYSGEEISAMHPLNFFQGDDKALLKERIDEVFSKGESDVTADFYTKDKRRLPHYFNGRKVNFNGTDYLIGMGLDISDRVRAENALIERNKQIEALSAHLENVREEERSRIALEIHDVLGQQLTALKMDSNWLKKRSKDDEAAHRITSMIALIDETIRTVRKISSELRPAILDDLGLIAACEWQGGEFEKNTGMSFEMKSEVTDLSLDRNFSTNVFRIFQEALTNIARHSRATKVQAEFARHGDFIELVVKDNGVGVDLTAIREKRSLGLVSMNERARNFKGSVNIDNNKPHGAIVNIRIPLPTSPKIINEDPHRR